MNRKGLALALSTLLLCFYFASIMYIFFVILHIHFLPNFAVAMFFEVIGFCFLAVLILKNIASKSIKTGYFISLVIITIFYTVLLDILNMFGIIFITAPFFVLLHVVLLFLYCLVAIPMYIVGRE